MATALKLLTLAQKPQTRLPWRRAEKAPVAMIVNSSELRAAGFDLREVLPLQLEAAARGVRRTRGAALKQIHGMGTMRYVLSVDTDNEFRSRCE